MANRDLRYKLWLKFSPHVATTANTVEVELPAPTDLGDVGGEDVIQAVLHLRDCGIHGGERQKEVVLVIFDCADSKFAGKLFVGGGHP